MRIDNTTFYFFNISSKNLRWKHHFYAKTFSNYLLLNMAARWGCISRRERSRGGEGVPTSNLVSHRWYDVEKLTSVLQYPNPIFLKNWPLPLTEKLPPPDCNILTNSHQPTHLLTHSLSPTHSLLERMGEKPL